MGDGKSEKSPQDSGPDAPARVVRGILRRASKGALATLEASGHPFASLVTVATAVDGTPLLLLSRLARHTRNLLADDRVSLLIEGADTDPDPLARGRVTVMGKAARNDAPEARRRFLAHNPPAATYAGFEDFAFFALLSERFHLVAGFGRIHELPADAVLVAGETAQMFAAAEQNLAADLTAGHGKEIGILVRQLGGAPGDWRICGIDPDGCDLVAQEASLRWPFNAPLSAPEAVRDELLQAVASAEPTARSAR